MKPLLKACLNTIGCALMLCTFSCSTTSVAATGPNVVMIVVDDLGWADVGFNRPAGVFETPHIDQLASESVQFTDAYAGAANCAPSRAVLMSGQYSPRHGVYTVSPSARGHEKTRKLIPVTNTNTLSDEVVTLAEVFKTKGYTTGTFGKWHLGDDPKTQGFDHNVAGFFGRASKELL